MNSSAFFRAIVRAESAVWVVAILFAASYLALPLGLHFKGGYADPAYVTLAEITVVGLGFIILGRFLPLVDVTAIRRIRVDAKLLLGAVWFAFIGFAILTWATADEIPIVAFIRGADATTIAELRESFLKGRGGWQSAFVYVNAFISAVLAPYCLALMFIRRSKLRWLCFIIFFIYSISYMEKSFFLRAIVPIFYLVSTGQLKWAVKPVHLIGGSVVLLLGLTAISMIEGGTFAVGGDFFAANYRPANSVDQLLWRSVGVPLFTAVDAIKVYETYFTEPLRGATSSLMALVTGVQRVPFERIVFAYEWGQLSTGTGSANSVYLTEAYINFGWLGVAGFSLVVGVILRVFARSRDEALRALWPLFVMNIYMAGLVGTLLSDGFMIVLLFSNFVRYDAPRRAPTRRAWSAPAQGAAAARALRPSAGPDRAPTAPGGAPLKP